MLLLGVAAAAQTATEPLAIRTETLSKATLRQRYGAMLRAQGGTAPFSWEVIAGDLPPGLQLEKASGMLTGVPNATGEFHFTIRIRDAGQPMQAADRAFILRVTAPLTLQWKVYPVTENNNAVRGAAQVTNGTEDSLDLTFIVVAVNEIGKAFALGYQRLQLGPEQDTPEFAFGSTLPAGKYTVHVDAVAEVPARNLIYRARLQSDAPLSLTGLP